MSSATHSPQQPPLSMGSLCALAVCTPRTVRFYQEQGIIRHCAATPGGRKLYPPVAVELIRLTRALVGAGWSVARVSALVKLSKSRRTQDKWLVSRLRKELEVALASVQARLHGLSAVGTSLASALLDTAVCEACAADDCRDCGQLGILRSLGARTPTEITPTETR